MVQDWGQIEPNPYGRWVWPFRGMKPGDYFCVDERHRPRGAVANQAYVAGNRMGKRFSVGDHPSLSGFTLVTCRTDEQMAARIEPKTHMTYGEAMEQVIARAYSPGDAQQIGMMMWGSLIHPGEQDREAVEMIAEPPIRTFTVASFGEAVVLVELKDDEIVMTGQPRNFTIEAWRKSKLLDD